MANTETGRASPAEIAAIIERACQEPGINEMVAIMQLSHEATEIQQLQNALTAPQPIIAAMSGTGAPGW